MGCGDGERDGDDKNGVDKDDADEMVVMMLMMVMVMTLVMLMTLVMVMMLVMMVLVMMVVVVYRFLF